MTTIALRSEFKKDKVTSDFFVRSHFVNNLKISKEIFFDLVIIRETCIMKAQEDHYGNQGNFLRF